MYGTFPTSRVHSQHVQHVPDVWYLWCILATKMTCLQNLLDVWYLYTIQLTSHPKYRMYGTFPKNITFSANQTVLFHILATTLPQHAQRWHIADVRYFLYRLVHDISTKTTGRTVFVVPPHHIITFVQRLTYGTYFKTTQFIPKLPDIRYLLYHLAT